MTGQECRYFTQVVKTSVADLLCEALSTKSSANMRAMCAGEKLVGVYPQPISARILSASSRINTRASSNLFLFCFQV